MLAQRSRPFSRLAMAGAFALSLGACASVEADDGSDRISPNPAVAWTSDSFIEDFKNGYDGAAWYQSDFELETNVQYMAWLPSQIIYDRRAGDVKIEVRPRPDDSNCFISGELQRYGERGTGRYEVVAKPASGSGLATSFFAYTDERFGDAHEEVSIQFIGKDTTKVQFGYVTAGQRAENHVHTLPFDAAEAHHLYAFERTADTVRWYVGDDLVHEIPADATIPAPTEKARLVANVWVGKPSQYSWMGAPNFEPGTSASFRCISHRAEGDDTPQCSSTLAD